MTSEAAAAPAPARVLVVDDEDDVRNLVCRVLADAGFATDAASGGAQALEKIDAGPPDLLVLDLMMPEVDGWTVLARLQDRPGRPPTVVLTAAGETSAFTRAVASGAAAYVAKPFRFADLVGTCRRVLESASRPPSTPTDERRREARRSLATAVTVLSRERQPIALGELVNLSSGGAQVELGVPLEPGTRVWVAFHTAGVHLTLECKVQWWQGSASRSVVHGLAFLNLNDEQMAPIRLLLGPGEPE